jgi:hypothetical protein
MLRSKRSGKSTMPIFLSTSERSIGGVSWKTKVAKNSVLIRLPQSQRGVIEMRTALIRLLT